MNPPGPIRYLVQSDDGYLHGYDREDILRCDLAKNKANPPRAIFRFSETSLTLRYDPIDASELTQPKTIDVASNQRLRRVA